MDQDAGRTLLLGLGKAIAQEVRCAHSSQLGREGVSRRDCSVHPGEPFGEFGPDVRLEAQRLLLIGQIDWCNIATFSGDDIEIAIRRRVAAPLRRQVNARRLRSYSHSAQIVAITAHHQIYSRARTNFK